MLESFEPNSPCRSVFAKLLFGFHIYSGAQLHTSGSYTVASRSSLRFARLGLLDRQTAVFVLPGRLAGCFVCLGDSRGNGKQRQSDQVSQLSPSMTQFWDAKV